MTGYQFKRPIKVPLLDPPPPCTGHGAIYDDPSHSDLARKGCAVCPHREACLQIVDPANNWYDGTSGGYTWVNGYLVPGQTPLNTQPNPTQHNPNSPATTNPTTTPTPSDPILDAYLKANPTHNQPDRTPRHYDHAVVQRLVDGTISPKQATTKEKQAAAAELLTQGHSLKEVARRLQMRFQTVQQVADTAHFH